MSKRKGRKPEITGLGVQLVGEILTGNTEAVGQFLSWRSDDRKQLPQYMSLAELWPLWEARERLPDDLIEFIEPWCADDGVRRKQNSVEAKRRKAEERLAQEEEAAAAADQAWDAAAPAEAALADAEAPGSADATDALSEPEPAAEDLADDQQPGEHRDAPQVALPPPKSPWELLGVRPGATAFEVRQAYRTKAYHAHPDREGGSTAAMAELNAARDAALGKA